MYFVHSKNEVIKSNFGRHTMKTLISLLLELL